MVAECVVSLLNPFEKLFALLANTTQIGKCYHPLRLAKRAVFEVLAYIYIRCTKFIEFIGYHLRFARHAVKQYRIGS